MHHHSHTIIRLAVHLPQSVYFIQGHEEQALLNANECDTHLTAWFKLNESDDDACHLLYSDVPTHYTFDSFSQQWRKRHKGGNKIISRMYTVSPNEQERYYLRIALLHIPGARRYNDLLTVGNTKCTYIIQRSVSTTWLAL